MDRIAWRVIVYGVAKGHNLAAKPPPSLFDIWLNVLSVLVLYQFRCFDVFILPGWFLDDIRFGSCPALCDPMDHSMPSLPVHCQLPGFTQTHVHWVGDTIQPSHPLLSPSPAFSLSQHQDLHMNLKRNDTNELPYKTETHRLRKWLMVAGGKTSGRSCTYYSIKMDNQQRPTV